MWWRTFQLKQPPIGGNAYQCTGEINWWKPVFFYSVWTRVERGAAAGGQVSPRHIDFSLKLSEAIIEKVISASRKLSEAIIEIARRIETAKMSLW